MSYPRMNSAINQYQSVGAASANYADPHRLVQMLMEGFLDRVARAKAAINAKQIQQKGAEITRCIDIIGALRGSLDHEQGGEVAANLEALYDYIQRRLVVANLHNDLEVLDEVATLLREVKQGWDAIPVEQHSQAPQSNGTIG